DFLGRHPLDELIRVWKQVAFQALCRDVQRPKKESIVGDPQDLVAFGQAFSGELASQLADGLSLADDHAVRHHLAAREHGENRNRIGSLRYLVLSRFQVSDIPSREGEQREAQGTVNHAGVIEDSRDVQEASMGGYFYDSRAGADTRGGGQDPPRLK